MKFIKKIFGRSQEHEIHDISERIYGLTDVGKTRKGNEDYFLVRPESNLFIVADGMGGHKAGEVASLKATEAINDYFTPDLLDRIMGNKELIRQEMRKSLVDAHLEILEMSRNKPEWRGMGCTIVIGLIDRNHLYLCHVGDARAYVGNKNKIQLLTTDHSVVMTMVKAGSMTMEEARKSPLKNEITQAIGGPDMIRPDSNHCVLKDGYKILLCSDGLWDMLPDSEIHNILKQDKSSKAICEQLVKAANKAGGRDNITVVIIVHEIRDESMTNSDFDDTIVENMESF